MDCSMPGFPVPHHLPELPQTHIHQVGMPSNHLILCWPLLLLPSIFPSIRIFSSESALHIRWPSYWSFSFCIILPMSIQNWFNPSYHVVGASLLPLDMGYPFWWDPTLSCWWLFSSKLQLLMFLKLWKEEKWKAMEKRKDMPIWMQSCTEEQGEIKPSLVINAKK